MKEAKLFFNLIRLRYFDREYDFYSIDIDRSVCRLLQILSKYQNYGTALDLLQAMSEGPIFWWVHTRTIKLALDDLAYVLGVYSDVRDLFPEEVSF
jgi:hypothetical protein